MPCTCMIKIQLKGHVITMSQKRLCSVLICYHLTPESKFAVTNHTVLQQERKNYTSSIKISKAT